jgi:hypothetical protein
MMMKSSVRRTVISRLREAAAKPKAMSMEPRYKGLRVYE